LDQKKTRRLILSADKNGNKQQTAKMNTIDEGKQAATPDTATLDTSRRDSSSKKKQQQRSSSFFQKARRSFVR
jgi:hypothetical protein